MKKYIYLDREKAKEGVSLVYGVSETKVENYKEYFEGNAVEFYGEDLPHFITYLGESDSIRGATEEEKLEKGDRVLNDGEVVIDGKIVSYDSYSQKIVEDQIVDKTRQDFIEEGIISLDSEKEKARTKREKSFIALDLYDKAVLRGDVKESELEKEARDNYRSSWLDITDSYVDLSVDISKNYPVAPAKIVYFE